MSDAPTPGREPRRVKPLLEQAAPPGPPAWLDENIRAAAQDAARQAARPASAASGSPGTRDRTGRRLPWRWGAISVAGAAVVIATLLIVGQRERVDTGPTLAQAPATRPEPPATQPQAAGGRSREPAPAITVPGEPKAERRAATPSAVAPPVPPIAAPPVPPMAAPAPAAEGTDQALAGRSAQTPQTPQTAKSAQALEADSALPQTAQKCLASVEDMRREQKTEEARRRLRACRERFPDHRYPEELLRELAP